jgi:hypothetical protein
MGLLGHRKSTIRLSGSGPCAQKLQKTDKVVARIQNVQNIVTKLSKASGTMEYNNSLRLEG